MNPSRPRERHKEKPIGDYSDGQNRDPKVTKTLSPTLININLPAPFLERLWELEDTPQERDRRREEESAGGDPDGSPYFSYEATLVDHYRRFLDSGPTQQIAGLLNNDEARQKLESALGDQLGRARPMLVNARRAGSPGAGARFVAAALPPGLVALMTRVVAEAIRHALREADASRIDENASRIEARRAESAGLRTAPRRRVIPRAVSASYIATGAAMSVAMSRMGGDHATA